MELLEIILLVDKFLLAVAVGRAGHKAELLLRITLAHLLIQILTVKVLAVAVEEAE
jgi:hypothetical protein